MLEANAPIPHDDAVVEQLRSKFPTESEPGLAALLADLPSELASELKTWEDLLGAHDPVVGEGNHLRAFQSVICSLARESGTGPSRLAFEHVQCRVWSS